MQGGRPHDEDPRAGAGRRGAVADQAFSSAEALVADGHLVVTLDRQGIGEFCRLNDARPMAPGGVALRYRVRHGKVMFATNAFFFEEGQARTFDKARFGKFRVDEYGKVILTGLRGPRLEALKPAR